VKKHYAYNPATGGLSIPAKKTINELGDMMVHYKGTYDTTNIIHVKDGLHKIVVLVEKTSTPLHPQREFNVPELNINSSGRRAGGKINTNEGVCFTKQQLLIIANAMDNEDVLEILITENFEKE
jgi:hypothetical protein